MMFIVFNVFIAIICEAIDGDYEEEFVRQAGDIQIVDYMTRRLKDILGMASDDERKIEADGEDLPEHKIGVMNQKMLELECIVDRLVSTVDMFDKSNNPSDNINSNNITSNAASSYLQDSQEKTMITEVVDYSTEVRSFSAMSNDSEII